MNSQRLLQSVLILRTPRNSALGRARAALRWVVLVLLVLALLAPAAATLAYAQSPDDGFNPGANGNVAALAVQADG